MMFGPMVGLMPWNPLHLPERSSIRISMLKLLQMIPIMLTSLGWYFAASLWFICLSLLYFPFELIFFIFCDVQLKHPSALNSFERISNFARNKKIAIFLDYDGTLSPIVDDPDRALMSDAVRITYCFIRNVNFIFLFWLWSHRNFWQMRDAVRNVAKYFPTAIISGRNRDKVARAFFLNFILSSCSLYGCHFDIIRVWSVLLFQVYDLVGLTELYYAGSHGMDIMGPVTNTNSVNSTDQQVICQERTWRSPSVYPSRFYFFMPNSTVFISILFW